MSLRSNGGARGSVLDSHVLVGEVDFGELLASKSRLDHARPLHGGDRQNISEV